MFEDTNFDFDDDALLGTSFSTAISSTQTSSQQKRPSQEIDKENLKKLKLSTDEQFNSSVSGKSENFTEKSVEISVNTPNRVVKRKFPGPAGLLPDRSESNKTISDLISDESYQNDSNDQILLCSQRTVSVYEEGPWKEMATDFYVPNGECPYKKFNISWIKKQASLNKLLMNHKAPFLAAVIQSLEIFDGKVPTVNITLKDSSGDIQGTVLHSVYEEYSNFFTTGSVLVLKQFGVLSAGYNDHCLTITANNLVTIYCVEVPKRLPNEVKTQDLFTDAPGVVKKIVIQLCSGEEIMKKYNEDVSAKEQVERSINFGKIYRNHGLLRSASGGESRNILGVKTVQENSKAMVKKSDFMVPKLNNTFNRTSSGNNTTSNLPLETLSKNISSDLNDTSKKKFNFKRACSDKPLIIPSPSILTSNKDISEDKNCDIIVSNSQSRILVRPDNREHSEIWKNLLEDVDTDSLFDDF